MPKMEKRRPVVKTGHSYAKNMTKASLKQSHGFTAPLAPSIYGGSFAGYVAARGINRARHGPPKPMTHAPKKAGSRAKRKGR